MRHKLPGSVASYLFLLLGMVALSTLFAFVYRTAVGQEAGIATRKDAVVTDAQHLSQRTDFRGLEESLQSDSSVYLPLTEVALPSPTLLCRFGVNALDRATLSTLADMRVGWYMNFNTAENPPRPDGMEYMQLIDVRPYRPSEDAEATYIYAPAGAELLQVIAANPGAKWLISNEPDSPVQGNLRPELYASAYHELYYLIKEADPTAKILLPSIIQATEVRLLYMDQILLSYQQQFGEPLPADGWSIHNYVLNEVSCDYNPDNCWGALMPPGSDQGHGEILDIQDNDRVDIFIERIVRFRHWLSQRGYTGQPVYLTEYGVLMPAAYGFTPARVGVFMTSTFDYLLSATDPTLGDPNDGYRLVQQWAWFSDVDPYYNGTLFDRENNYARTAMGDVYASYTASVEDTVDFYPRQIQISPPVPVSQGEPVNITLQATVANSGNLVHPLTTIVRFYNGHPERGGIQIGSEQVASVAGCGDHQVVDVEWDNVSPGTYEIYVEVTPRGRMTEANPSNNLQSALIVVATE